MSADYPRGLVSVVLPAHNEAESLPVVVRGVVEALGRFRFEIIIIDDGSVDRTWATICGLCSEDSRIRGLRFGRNFGHQAAMVAGLEAARGETVVTMDSDGQHPPTVLGELLSALDDGADVAQGVRVTSVGLGAPKRVASRSYYGVIRFLTGIPIVQGSADFRGLTRRAISVLLPACRTGTPIRMLVAWSGLETRLVPFRAPARIAGKSGYSWPRMATLGLESILGYTALPLRLIGLAGAIVSALAIAYLGYVLVVRLNGTSATPGWASVAGLVALLGGLQLLLLAFLGEYLARVYIFAQARPLYVIREGSGD